MKNNNRFIWAIRLVILVMATTIAALTVFAAHAAPRWPTWSAEDKVLVAKCVLGETDFRDHAEAAATVHVLVKRWARFSRGMSIGAMARAYCKIFDSRAAQYYGPRATAIRGDSILGAPTGGYERKWERLMQWVDEFSTGAIPDPCPAADHFGGEMDLHRVPASWRLICVFGKRAKNYFYQERTQ